MNTHSLKSRPFFALFSAQTLSALGDMFGLLATEWLVYELTGSLLAMGTLALAFGVPEVLVRFFGGPLVDRLPRVRLMIVLDAVRALAYAFPFVLGLLGELQLWHLFLTAILSGACSALFAPAGLALLPRIVKGEDLVRASSLTDAGLKSAILLGPLLAGTLIAASGALPGLAVNAASFALSALLLTQLPALPAPERTPTQGKSALGTYLREAVAGAAFFKRYPALLVLMCFVSFSNMTAIAVWSMMVPFAQDTLHLDALRYGLFGSVNAAGHLVGAILVIKLGDVKRRRLPMLGSLVVRGCLIAVLSFTTRFEFALALLFLIGVSGPFFGSHSAALFGRLVPNDISGRVMTIRLLVGGSLQPLGGFLGGAIAARHGIPFLFLSVGLFSAAVALVGFLLPLLKKLDGDLAAQDKNTTRSA